ncbi:MAG: hypothetical protein U5M23_05580 [Marinagarivorans sp.]|nr:hypothetical protein [Marinagarivorans sp.]
MREVYLLLNNDGLLLSKQLEWLDYATHSSWCHSEYKDEALNIRLELTIKSPEMRINIIRCPLNDKGQPCTSQTQGLI